MIPGTLLLGTYAVLYLISALLRVDHNAQPKAQPAPVPKKRDIPFLDPSHFE